MLADAIDTDDYSPEELKFFNDMDGVDGVPVSTLQESSEGSKNLLKYRGYFMKEYVHKLLYYHFTLTHLAVRKMFC